MLRLAAALFLGLTLWTGSASAQTQQAAPTLRSSPIIVIDLEEVFTSSLYGQRVVADYNAAAIELEAENRRIADLLLAEERSLTERRPSMDAEAFRVAAAEFDDRVQGIRRAQDTKERELQTMISAGRDAFLVAIEPVLGTLMREFSAIVVMDRRATLMRLEAVDVTARAIEEVDAALGDGATAPDETGDN